MSASILRTNGVFKTCTETFGSGARTGTAIIPEAQCVILSVLRPAPAASHAVVPGAARRAAPVPRIGTGTCPPAATTSWASASVSDQQAKGGGRDGKLSQNLQGRRKSQGLTPSQPPTLDPRPKRRLDRGMKNLIILFAFAVMSGCCTSMPTESELEEAPAIEDKD